MCIRDSLKTERGLVLLTGCAHPGIIKIIGAARELFGDKLLLLAGGFHLEWASSRAVQRVVAALQHYEVGFVAPAHCTGHKARRVLKKHFNDNCIDISVGKIVALGGLP